MGIFSEDDFIATSKCTSEEEWEGIRTKVKEFSKATQKRREILAARTLFNNPMFDDLDSSVKEETKMKIANINLADGSVYEDVTVNYPMAEVIEIFTDRGILEIEYHRKKIFINTEFVISFEF